jgi:hypothetical protein
MSRKSVLSTSLVAGALMTAFWAYTVMDTLIRAFGLDVTWVDLGTIFALGLPSGVALGFAAALQWPRR